jgi:protein O-GlcNAc transferase
MTDIATTDPKRWARTEKLLAQHVTARRRAKLLEHGYQFYGAGDMQAAVTIAERLLGHDPADAAAWYLTGICHLLGGNADEALSALTSAANSAPFEVPVRDKLADAYQQRGDWDGALANFQRAYEMGPTPWRGSNVIWAMAHHPRMSAADLAHAQWAFGTRWGGGELWRTVDRDWSSNRKLRVGYVGNEFIFHSAQDILGPIIFNHDRDSFELIAYSGLPLEREDPFTQVYQGYMDEWVRTVDMDDATMAQRILDDRIDVLVDISGHSGSNRLAVFGMKPAPVQVTGWGFAVGTGMREIDAVMTDAISAPWRWARDHLAEQRAWHLPCVVTFNPHRDMPDVAPPPAVTNGYLTFGYFGRSSKITREVLDVWARLLRAVPQSHFLLKGPTLGEPAYRDRIIDVLTCHGVDMQRVQVLTEPVQRKEHVDCYRLMDIALDTFPIPGGVTTLEGLWQGVPTISWPGDRMASRLGGAIMHHVGMKDWAVQTEDAGHAIGRAYADKPERLVNLRAGLRDKLARSPICQTEAYSRSVEMAYRELWRERVAEMRMADSVESEADTHVFAPF